MNFEEWLESDATKEFRGLLAFDRKAKELAKAAWLASDEAAEHTLAGGLAQWSCGCGYMNIGSFCSKCGSANPQAAEA